MTVHNQEENVYIQRRHNGGRSWIGLNDRSVEGSFVWTNKEVSSFRFWASHQPNNWRDGDCVHTLGAKHGYTWNDVSCDNCYNFTCFTGTFLKKCFGLSSFFSGWGGGGSNTENNALIIVCCCCCCQFAYFSVQMVAPPNRPPPEKKEKGNKTTEAQKKKKNEQDKKGRAIDFHQVHY